MVDDRRHDDADDRTPVIPHVEPRFLAAWREWLSALAHDPEAAIAAAHVYGELEPDAREAWLAALVEDAPKLSIPLVAVYAPLLAVETDPDRRERIELLVAMDAAPEPRPPARALRGVGASGEHVAVLVAPLYLQFVRVLTCRYEPHDGFAWARQDALLRAVDAPADGALVEGVRLEATPLKPVIEELAHAILAHGRRGLGLPEALQAFADLFDAHVDDLAD